MATSERWCRVTIAAPDGTLLLRADLGGPGVPDLVTVDAIGQLGLVARRVRGSLRVDDLVPRLAELLELAGLRVEMEG